MLGSEVLVEELKAGVSLDLYKETGHGIAMDAKEGVEAIVTETDAVVVLDGAAVVDAFNVGPHTGTKAHGTRFASSVDDAT